MTDVLAVPPGERNYINRHYFLIIIHNALVTQIRKYVLYIIINQ